METTQTREEFREALGQGLGHVESRYVRSRMKQLKLYSGLTEEHVHVHVCMVTAIPIKARHLRPAHSLWYETLRHDAI